VHYLESLRELWWHVDFIGCLLCPRSLRAMTLSTDSKTHFDTHGWVLSAVLNEAETAALNESVGDVQSWSDSGDWMHHYELTDAGVRRCRTEYFTPFSPRLRALLCAGAMIEIAGQLMGTSAVLYKEKINYKLAGGAGWEPHQDAPAYPFIDNHVSCMIAIDDATTENGCLELVSGLHHELIPTDERGCIPAAVAESLTWQAMPLRAGQVLWFHSRTPHRSGDNRSTSDRRALYPTYNAASEGDLREAYYARKRAELATAASNGERVQISLIDDFRGRPVPS